MEERKIGYKEFLLDGKLFWSLMCVALSVAICSVSESLSFTVTLGIFLLGAVGWFIIINEFLTAGKEKKQEYLQILTTTRPEAFKTFQPFLTALKKKRNK